MDNPLEAAEGIVIGIVICIIGYIIVYVGLRLLGVI